MAKLSNKAFLAINTPFMALLLAIMIALLVLCIMFASTISLYLMGVDQKQGEELDRALAAGSELCEDITDEGIVMLKNNVDENGVPTLPLTEDEVAKVNVFGWAAYDWLTGAFGSGFSNTTLTKLKLFPALEQAGILYNEELRQMYEDFYSSPAWERGHSWDEYRGDANVSGRAKFNIHEPGAEFYTDEVIKNASEFSDVAIVVLARVGGEGADLRKYQNRQPQENGSSRTERDDTRHYLEIAPEEQEMIDAAKRACDKVIVVLNSFNIMELGFVDDPEIDACLYVGLTGLTGVKSVISVLEGTVNPSGRTVDTFAYDFTSVPSFVTSAEDGILRYNGCTDLGYRSFVDYTDSIYVGYRYFETAAVEGEILYDKVVQYPFGYGLSYTDFEWDVMSVDPVPGSALPEDGKVTIEVAVTNTGDVAGKDVVQLYYTPPYTPGGIEKSHVNLAAFAKTPLLEPGVSTELTLEVYVQDMASYDDYDKNGNGFTGYELDPGEYTLKLMKNAHELADNFGELGAYGAELEFTVGGDGYQYETDRVTGYEVKNRFIGDDTVDGMSIDGRDETQEIVYMTRDDFAGTFPITFDVRDPNPDAIALGREQDPSAEQLAAIGDIGEIKTGQPQLLTINDVMPTQEKPMPEYDDPIWQQLVEQITVDELIDLLRDGYFKTAEIPSIKKPIFLDFDGPGGLNTQIFGSRKNDYVLYPNATLIAQTWNTYLAYQMGMSVGDEAAASDNDVRGWYAPGANIHRSPFGGRNAEYYSEDPLLSGKMCAETVRGAKNKGLYSYVKHFAVNESETERKALYTWMTEQSLREIYLRPFEIAIKEGGANGLMSAMNRVGAIWVGASRALCTDVLRGEWGFRGMIVTDWMNSGEDFFPAFKGIYAGNSTWLNNPDLPFLTGSHAAQYEDNEYFIYFAQRVAHDVVYTLADTEQTRLNYDPSAEPKDFTVGFEYNHGWVWMPILAETILLAILGVWTFLVVRRVLKNKKAAPAE